MSWVALIAGEGKLPLLLFEKLKSRGDRIVVFALPGCNERALASADCLIKLHVGRIGKAISICKKYKITKAWMAGRVKHKSIYSLSLWQMDWATLKLWLSLKSRKTDAILHAICDLFQKNGIEFLSTTDLLSDYLIGANASKETLDADALLGVKTAYALGKLDIGQTVVVKKNAVVAVEAMEGTDSCLDRAFALCGSGASIVKLAKAEQDLRFDVPVIGELTLKRLLQAKVKQLVVTENMTLCLEKSLPQKLKRAGIKIFSLSHKEIEELGKAVTDKD